MLTKTHPSRQLNYTADKKLNNNVYGWMSTFWWKSRNVNSINILVRSNNNCHEMTKCFNVRIRLSHEPIQLEEILQYLYRIYVFCDMIIWFMTECDLSSASHKEIWMSGLYLHNKCLYDPLILKCSVWNCKPQMRNSLIRKNFFFFNFWIHNQFLNPFIT
jgi:hypothetical protein